MAFEELGRLEEQLEELQHKAAGDAVLRDRIVTFAQNVYQEMELAFDGVDQILADVVNARKDQLSDGFVSDLIRKVDYSHSSKKFKVVLEVCDRLAELASTYRSDIDKALNNVSGSYSELFYLLERHEGLFRRTIESAVRDVSSELNKYVHGGDIDEARTLADAARKDLHGHLERVRKARISLRGRSGGIQTLLEDNARADNVLRNSAWFNGGFYLAAVLLLISTLSFFAGGLEIYKFFLVVVATCVGVTLIGAFQLRNDNKLSERAFFNLVQMALVRVLLPLSRSAKDGGKAG